MFTQSSIHSAFDKLFEARRLAGIANADQLPVPVARSAYLAAAMFCDVPFNKLSYFEEHLIPVHVTTVRLVPDNEVAHVVSFSHDTPEDVPDFFSEYVRTLNVLGHIFGKDTQISLKGLTNDEVSKRLPPEERIKRYQEHVIEAIENVNSRPVKCSDFYRNAGFLHCAPETKRVHLARKYLALYPIFIKIAREYGTYGAQISLELESACAYAKSLALA